jgi:hypothetical protein
MTALRNASPGVSAEGAEHADPAERPWSADQMLLAEAIDALRHLGWMYATIHAPRGQQPSHPEPIGRPGIKPRQRKVMTVAQYRQQFGCDPPVHLVSSRRA